MSKRRPQATIPEPYTDGMSLRASVLAMKELVEVLTGQRGDHDDQAVTFADMPALPKASIADTAWRPFAYLNGWVDYDPPFSPCGYRKLSSGLVLFRGLIKNGTATTLFTLPPGYRPGIALLCAAVTSPQVLARIDIGTDGTVTHTSGNSGWISLFNISFLAEN